MAQRVVDGVLYLDVSFSETEQHLDLKLDSDPQILQIEMLGGSGEKLPYYLGPYIVDPRKVEQMLETVNKSMSDNVVINPIYYAETSNLSGGVTAIIGLE